MIQWLKSKTSIIFIILVTGGLFVFLYGCPSKVTSLIDERTLVTRQELQLELNWFIDNARIRMADLDKQDQLRVILMQNALVLVQGQPFNPVGLITAVCAIYGLTQGASKVTKVIKTVKAKGKANNGTT